VNTRPSSVVGSANTSVTRWRLCPSRDTVRKTCTFSSMFAGTGIHGPRLPAGKKSMTSFELLDFLAVPFNESGWYAEIVPVSIFSMKSDGDNE
jgi:hypothetical protein